MKKFLLALSIPLIFSACSKNNKQVINASGSTTVLPVISTAAEQFMKTHSDVKIIVNAGGSGVGINQVGAQQIEIGMISRNITEKETSQYPKTKFTITPIGRDAVVPVVSSEIYDAGIRSLSINQLAKIYRGEISNWKELNGPDKEILVIDKEAARGTRHVFMEIVLGDKEAQAAGADLVLGANNEEQTAIVQSDAALGILSNAWMNKDVKGLAIIMENGEVIEPTLENIVNGKFPVIRDLDLVTNGEPTGITKEFIDYILSDEGQKIVIKNEYVSIAK